MLIVPCVYSSADLQRVMEWRDLAVSLAEEGRIDMERVDDSVRRILTLKASYGILDQTDFTATDELIEEAVNGVGSEENRQTAFDIAYDALTLYRNENAAYPLSVQEGEKVAVIFADSCASRVGTGDLVVQMLQEQDALPEGAQVTVLANNADNADECLALAGSSDHVILVHRVYSSDCLDPATADGFSSAVFDDIIAARHEAGQTVIVVSCQLPYDAERFPDADAVLLAYNSSPMRQIPPLSGADSAYAPNLPAALLSCFGVGEPGGSLPVQIPGINEEYNLVR